MPYQRSRRVRMTITPWLNLFLSFCDTPAAPVLSVIAMRANKQSEANTRAIDFDQPARVNRLDNYSMPLKLRDLRDLVNKVRRDCIEGKERQESKHRFVSLLCLVLNGERYGNRRESEETARER